MRPVLLVTVATSFELAHAQHSLSVSVILFGVIGAISSRTRQNGLQYVVEGYIQNIKINNEGDFKLITYKDYLFHLWRGISLASYDRVTLQYSNVAVWSNIAASNVIVQGMCACC